MAGSRLKGFLEKEFGGGEAGEAAMLQLLNPERASGSGRRGAVADHQLLAAAASEEGIEESSSAAARHSSKGTSTMFDDWGVYRGYVDDERNTDNAWIETVCLPRPPSHPMHPPWDPHADTRPMMTRGRSRCLCGSMRSSRKR